MSTPDPSILDDIIEDARDMYPDMVIYTPEDGTDYAEAAKVHNERLPSRPAAVVVCEKPDYYSFWFEALAETGLPLSLKSGGHHHEAMSSNEGGVVLLSSPAHDVEFVENDTHVWLGAGQRLGNVIKELAGRQRLLPTGVCDTVCVGGLAHGGGWGLSYRTLGPTIDRLREVMMVLPNGDQVWLNHKEYLGGMSSDLVSAKDLFWAIRGGGGGNFGAVTRFKFELYDPGPEYTEFTIQWPSRNQIAAAIAWAQLCETADHRLNFFARMGVVQTPKHIEENPAFVVGGRFYGNEDDCRKELEPLTDAAPYAFSAFETTPLDNAAAFEGLMLGASGNVPLGSSGRPLPAQAYAPQVNARSKDGPKQTCVDDPEPHKVSSAVPKPDATYEDIIKAVAHVTRNGVDRDGVNQYVSFHGMGGVATKIDLEDTAFPWRKHPFMLQAQAWWLPKQLRPDVPEILGWIDSFREKMESEGVSEGAFINFPDDDLPTEFYYGDAIYGLREVKTAVDRANLLEFPLGIKPLDT